jgi:hypothetical protein
MHTVEELIEQARHLSVADRKRLVEAVETSVVEEVIRSQPMRRKTVWAKEMRQVVAELRKGAEGYADEEIDQIVDDAVAAVRREQQQRKARA